MKFQPLDFRRFTSTVKGGALGASIGLGFRSSGGFVVQPTAGEQISEVVLAGTSSGVFTELGGLLGSAF